jgi:hypothetical protein
LKEFIDIDVAALYLCLMESICRSDSCYLSQNRFPGSNLYDIDNIVFMFAAGFLLQLLLSLYMQLCGSSVSTSSGIFFLF